MLLDWQSDGIVARLALVLYGMVLLVFVLSRLRRCGALTTLIPGALVWRFVIFAFTCLWLVPYYAAKASLDCYAYHYDGLRVAQLIRVGNWEGVSWGLSTAAIPIITGFLYAPFGGDVYGILFFSAVLSLCGGLYLCRAFSLWATPGQLRKYALIVLFLPSFALWTSIFGKDSWIMLGLGLTAYGYSLMLKPRSWAGLWHLLAGVAIVSVIRPHIAVTLVASMIFAYLWSLTQTRHASTRPKFAMAVLLIAMFALLAPVAREFVGLSEVSADGMQGYLRTQGAETQQVDRRSRFRWRRVWPERSLLSPVRSYVRCFSRSRGRSRVSILVWPQWRTSLSSGSPSAMQGGCES